MNLLRFFTAALMSLSLMGCCCNQCIVSDPCDPCGSVLAPYECPLTRFWPFSFHRGCIWSSPCSCGGCGGCGGVGMADPYTYAESSCGGGNCAGPVMSSAPASSGCGCSQGSSYPSMPAMNSGPTYLNTSPTMIPSNSTPQPIPEVPPSYSAPAASSEPQTMIAPGGQQPQMVSYEEFQKLPGNVVSGPGSSSAISIPAPVQQVSSGSPTFMAPPPPAPSAAKAAPRFVNPGNNRQAVWTPARGN